MPYLQHHLTQTDPHDLCRTHCNRLTDYWEDDGTEEYRAMFERIEREGIVLERA